MRIETDLDGAVVAAIERHYNHAKEHCDFYCAEANDCMVGGVRCERCGERFCATEIGEEGLCPDCAKARRADAEAEDAEAEDAEAEDAEAELGDLCRED